MKMLKLPFSATVTVSTEGTNLTEAVERAQELAKNRQAIIDGALSIEGSLIQIISYYFFGAMHEKKQNFDLIILRSSWCSFAEKRRIVQFIIEEEKLLNGKGKNDFLEALRKVGKWRNAFAHGSIQVTGQELYLCYFESKSRTDLINDSVLTDIETLFKETSQQIHSIAQNYCKPTVDQSVP